MKQVLKVNDEIVLDIKRIGINGEGVGFYKKLAVFVNGAIPPEGYKVRIKYIDEKMAKAEIIEALHISKNHITPKCPYYSECGGCTTEHIDYNTMLDFKRDILIESISRYTKLNPKSFEIKKTIGMDNPWNYRNKSSLLVKNFNGAKVCMLKENSNIFTPIDDCLIQNKGINQVNREICKVIDELHISLYNSKYQKGIIRYIVVRESYATMDIQVCLICFEKSSDIKYLAEKINSIENVKSVYVNYNSDRKSINIFGEETIHLCGEKYIIEKIGDLKYKLYPQTFFQLNSIQTKVLYDQIKKAAKLSFKEVVLDAYCGIGTISLYLAKMSKEVIGIELNKDSIALAEENAKENKIKNSTFLQGNTEDLLPLIVKEKCPEVIVLDPPRTGLGSNLCDSLVESNTKRIVYVSCNTATLAKDLNILSRSYNIKYIQPIDMFPQTSHVETIVLLEAKQAKK